MLAAGQHGPGGFPLGRRRIRPAAETNPDGLPVGAMVEKHSLFADGSMDRQRVPTLPRARVTLTHRRLSGPCCSAPSRARAIEEMTFPKVGLGVPLYSPTPSVHRSVIKPATTGRKLATGWGGTFANGFEHAKRLQGTRVSILVPHRPSDCDGGKPGPVGRRAGMADAGRFSARTTTNGLGSMFNDRSGPTDVLSEHAGLVHSASRRTAATEARPRSAAVDRERLSRKEATYLGLVRHGGAGNADRFRDSWWTRTPLPFACRENGRPPTGIPRVSAAAMDSGRLDKRFGMLPAGASVLKAG